MVVAGGGFAGLAAARELERSLPAGAEVTVVSDSNYQLYTPLLPGAAAGALEPTSVVVPLREQLRRCDLRLGRVVGGDPQRRTLEIETLGMDRPGADRQRGATRTLEYDHLVIALGSVSATRGVPGLAQYAIGFKTLAEAVALRNWLIATLEAAEAIDDPEIRAPYLTYVFAGAGYAGLEGIAELHAFADKALDRYPRCRMQGTRWILLQSGPRVMPEIGEKLADFAARKLRRRGIEIRTGTRLTAVTADAAHLSTGEAIATRTIVWTAGVKAHPVCAQLGVPLNEGGRIQVDRYMRVPGLENVWAIGDAAAVPDPASQGLKPCPPTAQHALRQGKRVAQNVLAVLDNAPIGPFEYKTKGAVVDLGPRSAVARTLRIRWRGFPAWVIARVYHAAAMPGLRRKIRLLADWGLDVLQGRDLSDLEQVGHPRSFLGELEEQSTGGTSGVHARVPDVLSSSR